MYEICMDKHMYDRNTIHLLNIITIFGIHNTHTLRQCVCVLQKYTSFYTHTWCIVFVCVHIIYTGCDHKSFYNYGEPTCIIISLKVYVIKNKRAFICLGSSLFFNFISFQLIIKFYSGCVCVCVLSILIRIFYLTNTKYSFTFCLIP